MRRFIAVMLSMVFIFGLGLFAEAEEQAAGESQEVEASEAQDAGEAKEAEGQAAGESQKTGNAAQAEVQAAPDYVFEGFDGDSANHDWETNLFFSRMQERTGISFQFRQYKEYETWTERKKEILKGEDLPDVLFKAGLSQEEVNELYQGGYIIDLKPYLEEYAPDLWALLTEHEDWMEAITLDDGSIPALPSFNELQNNNYPWINTTWLNALKLEMPTTAEEFTEVLRAFKTRDPNRNGGNDEIPFTFTSMWDLRFLGHAFGMIDNDYYVSCRDGKVSTSLNTEQNRVFLEWLHGLWEERLLDRNGFNQIDTLRQVTDSNAAITYGVIMSSSALTVVPATALDQYSLMPPLSWNGQKVYRDLLGDVIPGTFALTKVCKEPEKMVSWVNFLYTEEGSRMAQAGMEGIEYMWNEEGKWEWMTDATTVASSVLPEATISEGGTAPGLVSAEFQTLYSDESTGRIIRQMNENRQYLVNPFPLVNLSKADFARIAELQSAIAPYAEKEMACFVTGDSPITDESWNAFCAKLEELGLSEMIGIWQKYVK